MSDFVSRDQTPQEEAADWASWLDRFKAHIWPVFQKRGISLDTAASIYFSTAIYEAEDGIDP